MSALYFLAIPLVIILVGMFVVWLRHRQPTSLHSGPEAFRREMDALAPGKGERRGHKSRDDFSGRS